jgi:hypothetical protein
LHGYACLNYIVISVSFISAPWANLSFAFPATPAFHGLFFELVHRNPSGLIDPLLEEYNFFRVCGPQFHVFPDCVLDTLDELHIVLGNKRDGFSCSACTSCPSYPMNVVF